MLKRQRCSLPGRYSGIPFRLGVVLLVLSAALAEGAGPTWTYLFDFTGYSHNLLFGDYHSSIPRLAGDGNGNNMVVAGSSADAVSLYGVAPDTYAVPPNASSTEILAQPFSDTGSSGLADSVWHQHMSVTLRYPDVATDENGMWTIMWSDPGGQVVFSTKDTNVSDTWSTTRPLAGQGWDPRIATDRQGTWLAVCLSSHTIIDGDLLFSRSTDNGSTWSALQILNSNASTNSELDDCATIATDHNGNWIVGWHAVTTQTHTLWYTRSTDNAASWQAVAPLSSNPVTSTTDESDPQIATDGVGVWIATWRSNSSLGGTLPAGDHVLYARSVDNGATWSPPAAVSTSATVYPPVIACRNGSWIILWGGKCARSSDQGVTWETTDSPSRYGVVSVQPGGTEGTWLAVREDCTHFDLGRLAYEYTYKVYAITESAGASDWEQYE